MPSWPVVTVVSAVALGAAGAPTEGAKRPAPDPGRAIVLELFTSQGCSSCPPAERLLNQLGRDETTRGRLVPLAFHVDYWDEGGWVDPFGAREWTARQSAYGRALGAGMYTPQLVLDGTLQFPGGDASRARSEIAALLERPAPVRVFLTARKGGRGQSALTVDVGAEVIESVPARELQVFVALFENGLVTEVARGENAGLTLTNAYVVRRLGKALSLGARAGARKERTLALALDPAWRTEAVGVAAFVQDSSSMRIYGASAQPSVD